MHSIVATKEKIPGVLRRPHKLSYGESTLSILAVRTVIHDRKFHKNTELFGLHIFFWHLSL